MHKLVLPAVGAVAVAVSGCGATPPQVPRPEVSVLSHAISELGTHCGDAITATALAPNQPALRKLDALARVNANELVSVLRRNPAWIYESETVRHIAREEASDLDGCGLHRSASVLSEAAG
jgi:hypothetical protein